MRFSQKIGKTPLLKVLQINDMDSDLRISLWNLLKLNIFDKLEKFSNYHETEFHKLCTIIWIEFYKLPYDEIPKYPDMIESFIKTKFFKYEWFFAYDFIEFISKINFQSVNYKIEINNFRKSCNTIFEIENSAFRFIDDKISPITNDSEIKEIEEAIINSEQYTSLKGANIHLKTALDKISDKKNPDYRNSIKESISAVENVAKAISDNPKDTLGGALDKIKGKTKIHPALEKGFKQIYGYTSDSDGIRHALTENDSCYFEDAKFMIVSCSAFINYLIAKANKAGIELNK
jgi:hypothetical protein